MDLSTFTPQQRQSVRHLDGPLFIAAGAGSGKTFTLQQRIAYALLPESGPALSSIDEVLAITFMEKAAAEIKARVRSALRAEGMAQEALKVDSAWISTIHGMCSRILREHALEAGIDPEFSVLSEFDARQLRQDAIEEVLRAARESGEFSALFAEYGVTAAGYNGVAVSSMLEAVLAKAASFSQGLDAVSLGAPAVAAGAIARRLLVAYEAAVVFGRSTSGSKKPSATVEKTVALCEAACERLNECLAQKDFGYRSLADVLCELPLLTKTALGRNNEVAAEISLDVPRALDWAFANVNAALARPFGEELIVLARRVDAVYQEKMNQQAVLDNNGLLHRTLKLLNGHGDVAASYQRRFKLVMVDEFQDTNQMQVDLIKLVAGDTRLCTVGDAQQSIYRFNGADVTVFERQRESVRKTDWRDAQALEASLDKNFRSHSDVLAFVRKVCSQERVFGADFLDLDSARKPQEGRYRGRAPRIEVQLVSYRGSKGAGAVDAEAVGIARRFAALRDAGHKPGEMVVLLGKMTSADVYAAALRREGFECVFSGGRSFFQLEEVQTVRSVLSALANPRDTRALFSVLSSPLLHLSADDFIKLSTFVDDQGNLRRRSIEEGLTALRESGGECDAFGSALSFAAELFARARSAIKHDVPSRVLMSFLLDSGWLTRLQGSGTEGVATAANVLKAVRMVEDLERRPGYGFSRVARDFSAMAENDSSGPASLSVSGQNAVRIMTVHKSKGLEFPIVAVASYEPWGGFSDCFSMTVENGRVHVALSLKTSKVKPARDFAAMYECDSITSPSEACDAAQFARVVRSFDWEEEVREAQRKFYVACTRSSEYLLVSGIVPYKEKAEDALTAYRSTPIFDDVRAALMGESFDFPASSDFLAYGGGSPLRFERVFVPAKDDGDVSSEEEVLAPDDESLDEGAFAEIPAKTTGGGRDCNTILEVPVWGQLPKLAYSTISNRFDVFSYSSIAPHEDHLPVLERDDFTTASSARRELSDDFSEGVFNGGAESASCAPGLSATDFGSAFHRVGQLAVERLSQTGGLVLPPASSVEAIAHRYGVEGESRERLDAALSRWFASDVARRAETFDRVRAEVPFMVQAFVEADGTPRFLEGEIDLLAESFDGMKALVIDYKTGGFSTETPERLRQKHSLQATCYAYVLLTTCEYAQVDFAFVRVEQRDCDRPDQPQTVHYSFTRGDIAALERAIVSSYEAV